jgi:hypothetical protein
MNCGHDQRGISVQARVMPGAAPDQKAVLLKFEIHWIDPVDWGSWT